MIDFLWDETKNKANQRKHGVAFDEARSVFYDANARLIPDVEHSGNEDRFIILGVSVKARILTVVHCYKDRENKIRIISARKATRSESKQYEEHLK